MEHLGTEEIQLGKTGWILGDLPNLFAGALEVELYLCPKCGKLEFFKNHSDESGIAQKKCPKCGCVHDIDYPKCPNCKHPY